MSEQGMPNWRTADDFELVAAGAFRKSAAVYARFGTSAWPLAYISRPKSMTVEDFTEFIDALQMKVALQ